MKYRRVGRKRLHHPIVGDLDLSFEALELPADPGLRFNIYTAKPKTPSEDAWKSRLTDAVANIDAVVFTQGSSYGDASAAEAVDYGAVKNVLRALAGQRVRIALMTAIGVTRRGSTHDWKRRSERLVRASGNGYTIVRPGWFDCNDDDQLEITLLQSGTRHAGSPTDGVIARHQIRVSGLSAVRFQPQVPLFRFLWLQRQSPRRQEGRGRIR